MEYSNSQIREIISEFVHSSRDRELLCKRLIDGVVFEKLAEEFSLSVSQVKRIVQKESATVFKHVK